MIGKRLDWHACMHMPLLDDERYLWALDEDDVGTNGQDDGCNFRITLTLL